MKTGMHLRFFWASPLFNLRRLFNLNFAMANVFNVKFFKNGNWQHNGEGYKYVGQTIATALKPLPMDINYSQFLSALTIALDIQPGTHFEVTYPRKTSAKVEFPILIDNPQAFEDIKEFVGGGGYSTVLPTAEVIPPRRPPPSKPESGGKSATVGALGTSKTRTRHLRVRMRAGGHWADTQWLYQGICVRVGT
ncbi:uncharacterized protein LOC118486401 [Helianthus annuus]|uniref:uncharacterized protein LOC118486401 n=1 Tax=Helianthus annuus TaxID=4232 RepID=UPI001652F3EF|nr:uncharacterized protein LOC118486401 [Helianthus annuus]XP_035838719.1 uncharacterized protein LOC118486401 [Helianthus annuus]XP_035838720.1 uncharacterized protein LOC118486401 [Helianthus annuus]XP_035838721.1 uncharacterized protein LOC118486401 [Helianthus annuus]